MSALPRFGGEGEFPYKRDRGAHHKFQKESLRGTKILFVRVAWNCFHPQEVPILKQHNISCHIVSAQYPAGAATAPDADFSRTNTLRDTKTNHFLIP